jgi:predicted nucleic acid-binding Zn ribbon protein
LETGETIEVQQSFHDAPLTEATHPVTGATMAVKKVFLPVGITFKGDGFYKTDSRAKGSSAGSKSSTSASESSSSSSSPDSGSSSSSSDSGSSSASSGAASTPAAAAAD